MKESEVKTAECEHSYDPAKYSRDDQGFYVDCVQCGKTLFLQADTEDEFLGMFDLGDDD